MVIEQLPAQFGKYLLIQKLGSGGMAEVYLARSVSSGAGGRRLVVKMLLDGLLSDNTSRSEFLNEARLMSMFLHPNIIEVHDLGEENGVPFIVLEYSHGVDLARMMAHSNDLGVPIPEDVIFYVMTELLDGLAAVHGAADKDGRPLEIVHGDVNPTNIFISYDGEVKLGDFGIAKTLAERKGQDPGVIKGKIGYLAPEQVEGRGADPRTDIFAAGVVLWEMLSGKRLFTGKDDEEILAKVQQAEIPDVTRHDRPLPESLKRIVLRALERRPNKRFQTAKQFSEELEKFVLAARYRLHFQLLRNFVTSVFDEKIEEDEIELGLNERNAGSLAERSLVRLMADLIKERATGRLMIERKGEIRHIFFMDGVVHSVTSSIKDESLGEFLVKEGKITRIQLEEALVRMRQAGSRLGDALISTGAIQPHLLLSVLQKQTIERLMKAFAWPDGLFIFYDGEECLDVMIPIGFGTMSLLAEGTRTHMPFEEFMRVLGPFISKKPRFKCDDEFQVDAIPFTPRELRVLRMLESGRTIEEIGQDFALAKRPAHKETLSLPYLLHEIGVLVFD
jgi:serine/threonine protein kinase